MDQLYLPCLAEMFDVMVDVQELVDHRSLESRAAETRNYKRMGLRSALIAMHFAQLIVRYTHSGEKRLTVNNLRVTLTATNRCGKYTI